MKIINGIETVLLLIGVPANLTLMLAIVMATTREIKTYSIIQFNSALFDLFRVISEFMVQERLVFEWPYSVFIYQGPCTLIGRDLCWFLQQLVMNFFFYAVFLITFSIWYRNAALKGKLPGTVFVSVMMAILPSPILIYMYTFTSVSSAESAWVIISKHPSADLSSLVFVGMSAHDATPLIFTISTIIFPIPAYIVISYNCAKILKAISLKTNMSTKTKRMHESFMKALLYTAIQPTCLFCAILITVAQNLNMFKASELSESILTLNEMRCCFGRKKELGQEEEIEEDGNVQNWTWAEWKRPVIAVIVTFLCNVENAMLSVGEWPYMATIDHDATTNFYGIAVAVSKAGHAIFAFVFAIWAYKIAGIKIPMLVGRCITLASCVMYIFVEFIPVNRRWWMLTCYVLFGIGFGTSPLLRSYIARHTSEENRSTAYALQNGATVLSVIIGPLAQICFSGLPYPGASIIPPNINLNIFTAPIWFAVITNVIAIVLIIVVLDDPKEEVTSDDGPVFSFGAIRERLASLRSLHLPWILIYLVLFEKIITDLATSTTAALGGPVMTVMYALTGSSAVLLFAIAQVIVGVLALALSLLFFACKLGRFVSCRVLFVVSNIVVIVGYIITYPFPFSSNPMQPFNETTRAGCNPEEYSWCDRQLAVNIIPYVIILIITNAFALPAVGLSLDTIYSKMIGNIDQNVMQSLFIIASDIVQIVGPIYGTEVFTATGLNIIHIINGAIYHRCIFCFTDSRYLCYIVGTVVWLAAWRWLRPYN